MKYNRNGSQNIRRGLLRVLIRSNKIRGQSLNCLDNNLLRLSLVTSLIKKEDFVVDAMAATIMIEITYGGMESVSHANNLDIEQQNILTRRME